MEHRVYTKTEKSYSRSHKVNEDSYLFSEYSFMEDTKICLLVVADGMGGLEDGEKASKNAVKGFVKAFYEEMVEYYMNTEIEDFSMSYFADQMEKIIKDCICVANKEVCNNADVFKQTGTTISVVCIVGEYAVTANVGDSPIYFYRSKARQLKMVSTLQTQAELDVLAGRYKRYSVDYYANDHKIYNSLGQYSELDKEDICCSIISRLEEEDFFLIGSDGAFGRMKNHEILELAEECLGEDEGFFLSQLFELARMDKDDDQTAILYIV